MQELLLLRLRADLLRALRAQLPPEAEVPGGAEAEAGGGVVATGTCAEEPKYGESRGVGGRIGEFPPPPSAAAARVAGSRDRLKSGK